jgi:hypothetical protein
MTGIDKIQVMGLCSMFKESGSGIFLIIDDFLACCHADDQK